MNVRELFEIMDDGWRTTAEYPSYPVVRVGDEARLWVTCRDDGIRYYLEDHNGDPGRDEGDEDAAAIVADWMQLVGYTLDDVDDCVCSELRKQVKQGWVK